MEKVGRLDRLERVAATLGRLVRNNNNSNNNDRICIALIHRCSKRFTNLKKDIRMSVTSLHIILLYI